MRLRTLSELLIATALASCKSGPPVAGPPDEAADIAAESDGELTSGEVAPAHPNAKWRWVSLVELARMLAPPAVDARGVYVRLVQPGGTWQWGIVAGMPIHEWCAGQSTDCPLAKAAPTTGLVTVTASGAVREATYASLRAGRARRESALGKRASNDPVLRAFDHLFGDREVPSTNGVFIARDGTGGNSIPADLAMTRIAPVPAPPGLPLPIGRPVIATDVALRLKELRDPSLHAQGAAAVEARLLKLPSEERAIERTRYHLSADLSDGVVQVTRLARGWFVEIMPEEPMGSCSDGARPGMHAAVVLGEHVDVVRNESAQSGHCRGRRPPGFALAAPRDADPIARFYAEATQLEAASVDAFELLADELVHHGAPAALIERTRAAARDESRHAAVMAARAHAAGAAFEVRATARPVPRTLLAIALDNAVEGCVHEAFAAVIASYQAAVVDDRELAAIAVDELEHGQLAWDLAAWLADQLAPVEQLAVERARTAALDGLVAAPGRAAAGAIHDNPHACATLGLPSPAQLAILVRGFASAAA